MTAIPQAPLTGYRRPHNRAARVVNLAARTFCYASAATAIGVLFFIFGYILYRGVASVDLAFFTALPGPPGEPGSGMRNAIVGTLVLVAMASLMGVPVGMLTGIYLSEYARGGWFANTVRLIVDVLAGVPSIIVGVLGYELVVVPLGNYSAWAGALALGFMMCPIIARTTEEILHLVPKAYREASVGVGASQFQTLFRVVLPAARGGIITGIMLAVARVAGETAPLLFTALGSNLPVFTFGGSFPYVHAAVGQPFPSLTVQIFNYAQSPVSDWIRQAWAGMLVLIVVVFVLNLAVRYVSRVKT